MRLAKQLILWLLSFVVACAYGPRLPEARSTDRNAKITDVLEQYTTRAQWQRSGFFRVVEDAAIALPVQVAIALDGTACIVTHQQWMYWRERAAVACETNWRPKREGD